MILDLVLQNVFFCLFIPSLPVDALDPEKLVQCPYDKNHQIRACRFPYHLIKCRKNHPEIVKQLATCPFNARHQVPKAEISHHISSCDDKSCIEQDIVNTVSMWKPPPCDEDWDKGEEYTCSGEFLFIFFSPGSSVTMGLRSNLMSDMRAPKSLPYTLPWKTSKYECVWFPTLAVSWDLHVSLKWNVFF
uniref:Gametocyte specific factor 1 n=1 Tax=Pelusios castaneus TaxID=367368 RepID=A0A8C8RPU3_9SAUR